MASCGEELMNDITHGSSMVQQAIVDSIQALSLAQQQAVLSFAKSLPKGTGTAPSLRELAKLPVAERNQILAAYVPMMAEDFATMPELTEFSMLDDEDWEE
jgi:hypothetical protein